MDAITKAAVITWLLDRKIKVVHIWSGKYGWSAMVETPPCGTRKGVVTYPSEQRVGSGSDYTAVGALTKALENAGAMSIEFRLHMLGFLVDHLANRAAPALLRRIDHGR